MGYSSRYLDYISSPEWAAKKQSVWDRNRVENCGVNRCDHCGTARGRFSVHHVGKRGEAYKSLGNEPLDTLALVCDSCHSAADSRRRAGLEPIRNHSVTWEEIEEMLDSLDSPRPATTGYQTPAGVEVVKTKSMTAEGVEEWNRVRKEFEKGLL